MKSSAIYKKIKAQVQILDQGDPELDYSARKALDMKAVASACSLSKAEKKEFELYLPTIKKKLVKEKYVELWQAAYKEIYDALIYKAISKKNAERAATIAMDDWQPKEDL